MSIWTKVKQFFCSHEFYQEDLKPSGIPEPQRPDINAGFEEWCAYYQELWYGDAEQRRVTCHCHKCGKRFYAPYGLLFVPTYGEWAKERKPT